MIARGAGREERLTVAVPKGALFSDSVGLLGNAGLDVSLLSDPGRNLVIEGTDARFVISKPTDVPSYVAYGAADCGIAGKDVLVEAALDVVELVDLGFGGCRFVVAALEEESDLGRRYSEFGVLRVATKYPRVAERHFAERGIQVEVVKLSGNIEVAPLVGIADCIVDITATGTTLRQNGLSVVEEVWPSTARFVANPASIGTDARVVALADRVAQLRAE